jgi:hypothetical protein
METHFSAMFHRVFICASRSASIIKAVPYLDVFGGDGGEQSLAGCGMVARGTSDRAAAGTSRLTVKAAD